MATDAPKFPDVHVQLLGQDGNGFFIASRTRRALHKGGATREEQAEFFEEALSGDYDHLLATVEKWVSTDDPDDIL